MPTLFCLKGYSVRIYPNDHRPSHVHVVGADSVVVFKLGCPGGPVEVREVHGKMKIRTVRRLAEALTARLAEACAKWREIHGDY